MPSVKVVGKSVIDISAEESQMKNFVKRYCKVQYILIIKNLKK